MDAAIAEVGAKPWQVQTLDTPASGQMECPAPFSFSKFTSEACRPISNHVKSIQLLFDVQEGIEPSVEASEVSAMIAAGQFQGLPEVLAFKAEVPEGSKVDLILAASPSK